MFLFKAKSSENQKYWRIYKLTLSYKSHEYNTVITGDEGTPEPTSDVITVFSSLRLVSLAQSRFFLYKSVRVCVCFCVYV